MLFLHVFPYCCPLLLVRGFSGSPPGTPFMALPASLWTARTSPRYTRYANIYTAAGMTKRANFTYST